MLIAGHRASICCSFLFCLLDKNIKHVCLHIYWRCFYLFWMWQTFISGLKADICCSFFILLARQKYKTCWLWIEMLTVLLGFYLFWMCHLFIAGHSLSISWSLFILYARWKHETYHRSVLLSKTHLKIYVNKQEFYNMAADSRAVKLIASSPQQNTTKLWWWA